MVSCFSKWHKAHAISKEVHAQAVISILTANQVVTFDVSGSQVRKQEISKETGSEEQRGIYIKQLAKRNTDRKAKSKRVCLLEKKYVACMKASQQAVLITHRHAGVQEGGKCVRRQVVNKISVSQQGNRCSGTAPSFFIHICIL